MNNNKKHLLIVGNYILDKRLFRYGILIIILFALFIGSTIHFKQYVYINCPEKAELCENHFYNKCFDKLCETDCQQYCNNKTLLAGTHYGQKPKDIITPFVVFSLGLLLLFFSINHFVYNKGKNIFKELNQHSSVIKFIKNG